MPPMTHDQKRAGIEAADEALRQLGWANFNHAEIQKLLLCTIMSLKTELAEAFAQIEDLRRKVSQ